VAPVSARCPALAVTVRVPDQRAVGRRSIRPAVRVPDHSANGAAFIRAMVRHEDQTTIGEPAFRPLVRYPDHAERRPTQPVKELLRPRPGAAGRSLARPAFHTPAKRLTISGGAPR